MHTIWAAERVLVCSWCSSLERERLHGLERLGSAEENFITVEPLLLRRLDFSVRALFLELVLAVWVVVGLLEMDSNETLLVEIGQLGA